jgi:uncharacterized protein
MLIRVSITNFKSFNEETEFNMLPSSEQRTHKEHVYAQPGVDLLKMAAIYGANGAGKSNLVKAIAALQNIVAQGGNTALEELTGHKLVPDDTKPTTIEIEFMVEGIPYLYGISAYSFMVLEEWLYISGLGTEDKLIFRRDYENEELRLTFNDEYTSTERDKYKVEFLQNDIIQTDWLVLSQVAAFKEGFDEIKKAHNWINESLQIVFPDTSPNGVLSLFEIFESYFDFTNELLCSFHTGVERIELSTYDLEEYFEHDPKKANLLINRLKKGYPFIPLNLSLRDKAIAMMENDKPVIKDILLIHKNTQNEDAEFVTDDESDGTNRLLDLTSPLYSAIYHQMTVIIDEIDQSIHPALLKELVRKFADDDNTKGQLIFTTHESNLLDQSMLRRDEIWFAEKHEGATKLYPMSDFDIRLDLDIRKGYLNGRFGAVPFLGNLKDLNWSNYAETE